MNPLLVAALAVIALGTAVNALNIGFMAGAGWHMAAEFAAGSDGMAPVFEGTHPIGLYCRAVRQLHHLPRRAGAGLGGVERRDAAALARLARLGSRHRRAHRRFFFNEASRIAVAAVALLMAWELATALRVLRSPLGSPGAGTLTAAFDSAFVRHRDAAWRASHRTPASRRLCVPPSL